MEHHKNLYKDQRSHTPRQHKRINRELQEANRNKRRRDRFQDSRNISPNSICLKKDLTISMCPVFEENTKSISKIVGNVTNPEKLTKAEALIKRFKEYKEKKNLRNQAALTNKKKPFISAVNSTIQKTNSSLVPIGHHEGFRPPVGLKNPKEEKGKAEENKSPVIKGRQSTYTLVATPPRKHIDGKCKNKLSNAEKVLPTNSHRKALSIKKISNVWTHLVNTENKSNSKTPLDTISVARKCPSLSTAKSTAAISTKALEEGKTTTKSTPAQPPSRKDLRPRVLKMPPPPISSRLATTAPRKQTGAIPKVRKRTEFAKPTKKSPLRSGGAHLAQNLKTKKPLNSMKAKLSAMQFHDRKITNMSKINQLSESVVIKTPRDFATLNPFDEFVTSTKIKSSSHIENGGSSAIGTSHKHSHGSSSAKRNILQETNAAVVEECDNNVKKNIDEDDGQSALKKFDFIRYSCGNDESKVREEEKNASLETTPVKSGPKERPASKVSSSAMRNSPQETNAALVKDCEHNVKKNFDKNGRHSVLKKFNFIRYSCGNDETQVREEDKSTLLETTPVSVTPYVSVTRGKVSLKTEKEKRNSIYLQNVSKSNDLPSEGITQNSSPKYSIEVRRTLEAVRYFRKQLQDEIDRLHQLCDIWEDYKNENLEKIQNASGEDMINVTIGQTRLLTSKKFMQFKGLIDRCESGATGVGHVEYDGSENTKSITSADLEGFWSMLGIQIDNLDKRFENLNRWKMNEWQDPDTKKVEIKKKLTKVKKVKAIIAAKAKPNSALQQMLLKMQAEMRKNKNKNEDLNEVVILTSSKQNQRCSANNDNTTPRSSLDNSSSRRVSITVKDRKYFSPAATVLSVSSPNRRTSKSSQDSPKIVKHIQKFHDALDSLRKSVLINENSRRMSLKSQSPVTEIDRINIGNKENAIFAGEKGTATPNNRCLPSQSTHQSPVHTGRKSILKTPGTAKSRLRNVIFNERLRVKKFNFLINEDGSPFDADDGDDTHEEDLAKGFEEKSQSKDDPQRTLTLRNRKVHLRPSCEIVIPTKK